MKIDGKEYRIKEVIYGDGKTEYTAQYAINFILFKIWKNYICETIETGYGTINCICCGNTYEDCKEHLLETIEKKRKTKLSNTIKNIDYKYK